MTSLSIKVNECDIQVVDMWQNDVNREGGGLRSTKLCYAFKEEKRERMSKISFLSF